MPVCCNKLPTDSKLCHHSQAPADQAVTNDIQSWLMCSNYFLFPYLLSLVIFSVCQELEYHKQCHSLSLTHSLTHSLTLSLSLSLTHTHTHTHTHNIRHTVCTHSQTNTHPCGSRQCPLATRSVACGSGRVLRLVVYGCWFLSAAIHCGCQLIHCRQPASENRTS